MQRSMSFVVTSSVLVLTASVWGGDNRRPNKWGGISEIISAAKQHHDHKQEPKQEPTQLDPGRPDGRVPTADVQPPARPGMVWVGDHWERVKAPQKTGTSVAPVQGSGYPAGAVIRDHRTPEAGAPIVPRGPAGRPSHRYPRPPALAPSNGQGGVTVTVTDPSKPPRDNAIIGTGFPFDIFDVGEVPPNRDHRTKPKVTDHRR